MTLKLDHLKNRIVFTVFGMSAIALNSVSAFAGSTGDLPLPGFEDIRSSIVSAEVILAPKFLESRHDISEGTLPHVSCAYKAVDPKDLNPLLDILASAGMQNSAEEPVEDLRMAVYLTTSSGSRISLTIGAEYDNSALLGKLNNTPVKFKNGFGTDLRVWAANRRSTTKNAACQK